MSTAHRFIRFSSRYTTKNKTKRKRDFDYAAKAIDDIGRTYNVAAIEILILQTCID